MTLAYWSILATAFLPALAAKRHAPTRRNKTAMKYSRRLPPRSSSRTRRATPHKRLSISGRCCSSRAVSLLFIAISATARCCARRCLASTCSASSRCLSRRRRARACHFECRRYADCLLPPPRVPLKKAFAFFKGTRPSPTGEGQIGGITHIDSHRGLLLFMKEAKAGRCTERLPPPWGRVGVGAGLYFHL